MHVRTLWLSLVAALIFVSVLSAEDDFARVREDIGKSLERQKIPSLAVAVVKKGQIVWEEGFGWANRERKISATPHTPYSIASISKPITATALMVLVERGLVDLDKPANDYLGEDTLTAHGAADDEATVRQLANHTSGLPLHYQFFYADESRKIPSFADSVRRYGHLLAPPGEEYQYANFGYGVLDEIISRVSKQSYPEFLQQEVFQPLGMQRSAVGVLPAWKDEVAVRYNADGQPLPDYGFDHPGASAVYSSAHDLARFALLFLQRTRDDQKPILSPSMLEEMQKPTGNCGNGRHYGVGWFVQADEHGYRTVSHTGGMSGVRCRLVMVPSEQIAVAVLCNASTDLPLKVTQQILAAMLPEYGPKMYAAAKHQPGPEPGRPFGPPELVGYWAGDIETYAGKRRLELWAHEDGDVKVRFAGGLVTLLNQSLLRDGLLTGVFAGALGTADADHRPHHIHLRLRLRGEMLNGAATAMSLPGLKGGNALSHWTELKRIDADPTLSSLFNGHNLNGWRILDENDFERHGVVKVVDGEIVMEAGNPATGISWGSNPPRMNYELTLEARRTAGSDFFCGITFPVNDNYLSLILGGWGGGVTGISNLNGNSAVENETTGYREFELNRWYAVRLRVTPGRVEVWLDQDQIVDVDVSDAKLSIWWEQEPVRPLGIASWYTAAGLRNIRLKRLAAPE